MHELSVAQSMMSLILENVKNKNPKKIIQINIVVGKLSGVVAESLKFCFESIKMETIAKEAKLVIEERPARAHCAKCHINSEAGQYDFFCPNCESLLEIKGGKELYVKELEIE